MDPTVPAAKLSPEVGTGKRVTIALQEKELKNNTPGGTRTHNRLIRSQTPYPLGHGRFYVRL